MMPCKRAEIMRLAELHSFKECGCDACTAEDDRRFWEFVERAAKHVRENFPSWAVKKLDKASGAW